MEQSRISQKGNTLCVGVFNDVTSFLFSSDTPKMCESVLCLVNNHVLIGRSLHCYLIASACSYRVFTSLVFSTDGARVFWASYKM